MVRRYVVISIVIYLLGARAGLVQGGKQGVHVVERGETLWAIARLHKCTVAELRVANGLGDGTLIRPGQSLKIPECGKGSAPAARGTDAESMLLTHQVVEGDTLIQIAKRYDTTVQDIQQRNRLQGNLIRPGQKLRVAVGRGGEGRAIVGQSMGAATAGWLVNAMQLPPGQGYHRRRPQRAWGANHTIFHIRRAVSVVRGRHPKVHALAIGDISSRKGGPLAQHKSHQSGRDADIGLYFKKRPEGYPTSFVRGTEKNLDLAATWALLEAFASTASSPSGVEKMFLNYELQEIIYKWAKKNGVSQRTLDTIFQYPHGMYSPRGLIRHEDGHDAHVHVRFKCPANDKGCR